MKVHIQDYEVEIFAKDKHNTKAKKSDKQDTFALLNWLVICMNDAAERQEQKMCFAISKEMKDSADKLFKQLREKGWYNNDNND